MNSLAEASQDLASETQSPNRIGISKETHKAKQAILLRFLPSLTDLAFLFPIAALFVLFQGTRSLLADCDTGWHIRTGDWILQNSRLPYSDIFSFTMPDKSWFAWEWGWDVAFSLIHRHWSLSGVLLANTFLVGVIGVLLYRLVRKQAPNDVIAFVITGAAMLLSSLHWLARPHLISWIFILAFLHAIESAERGNRKWLWGLPFLSILWVNVHASFFVGLLFLLTYATGHGAQALIEHRRHTAFQVIRTQPPYFLCALACLAASLANPYGWRLHQHVIAFLSDSQALSTISEYGPVSLSKSPILELFFAAGYCAALYCFASKQWARALILLTWSHLALTSVRNVPIFLFVAAPIIASSLAALLNRLHRDAGAQWQRNVLTWINSFGRDLEPLERVERIPLLPLTAMVFLGVSWGIFHGGRRLVTDFDKRDFPVTAVARIPLDHRRVFTFDQWGDYLIYKLFPGTRVFVDGRADFYGADFGKKWTTALKGSYDWKTELSQYSIDTVLLKADAPLSSILKLSNEWKSVYDDGTAIVFQKK